MIITLHYSYTLNRLWAQ